MVARRIEKEVAAKYENWRKRLAARLMRWGAGRELADKSGLHNTFLSRLAAGSQQPSLDTALRISAVYEESLDEACAPFGQEKDSEPLAAD